MLIQDGKFYLSPLPFTPTGNRPWFFEELLSLKTLQGLLKRMCQDGNIEGNLPIIVLEQLVQQRCLMLEYLNLLSRA